MSEKPAIDYEFIDENIRELVYQLNELPGVRPFASCEGHENPIGTQSPFGLWFVNFKIQLSDLSKGGSRSLARIASLETFFFTKGFSRNSSRVVLEVQADHDYSWNAVYFSLQGRIVGGQQSDPSEVAEILANYETLLSERNSARKGNN